MKNNLLKKAAILVLLLIVLRAFLVLCWDYINMNSSHYLYSENNCLTIDDNLDDKLYYISNKGEDSDTDNVLYIKSSTNQDFSLLINNLTFSHEIYVNDRMVSQNINEDEECYDSDYAYKYLRINSSDYIDHVLKVDIKGNYIDAIDILLAKDYIADDVREIRTILYAVLLMLLVSGTFTSLSLYFRNLKDHYFLIFTIMGAISIFRTLVLGSLFSMSRFFGMTVGGFDFLDCLTSILHILLPIFIFCYLFDLNIKNKYTMAGLSILSLLGFYILITCRNYSLYNTFYMIAFLMKNAILIVAYLRDKKYSNIIMIIAVLDSSCSIYHLLVSSGLLGRGNIMFLINPSYLGSVIYLVGFSLAVLRKNLDKVRELDDKKKEYERVLLLRGISHDLKLPLSVIKLNNQIIEKYNLTGDEIREYAQTSLAAAQDLEKMTENINNFLTLKEAGTLAGTTSVRECFEKLKNYYASYNVLGNSRFIAECDEKDAVLDIHPLYFNRMLYNLVDNAFKHSNGERSVMASYKIDQSLEIIIEDEGLGMSKDEMEKIFEPFYRTDRSRLIGGLGLGLSVVKEIVDTLHGTIKIVSERGVGTKVTVTIQKFRISRENPGS